MITIIIYSSSTVRFKVSNIYWFRLDRSVCVPVFNCTTLAILIMVIQLTGAPAIGQDSEVEPGIVAFEEHLGEYIPGDIVLRDEDGQEVTGV